MALLTKMPMVDTRAPNVSTDAGVGNGTSCSKLLPPAKGAWVGSAKGIDETFRLVPHCADVEGSSTDRDSRRRATREETRMAREERWMRWRCRGGKKKREEEGEWE